MRDTHAKGAGIVLLMAVALIAASPDRSVASDIDTPVATDSLAACDASVREHPTALDSYRCYRRFARRRGQIDLAIHRIERLLQQDVNNHRARLFLAALLGDQGQARAEGLFQSAIAGFSGRHDVAAEATARLMLSNYLMRRGRVDDAAAQLADVEKLLSIVNDEVLRAYVTIAEGWLAYRRNDYGRAWSLLKQLEDDLPSSAPIDARSTLLSALGAVSWATGRVQAAVDYYRQEATLLHEAGSLYDEASARINLTLLADTYGRPRAMLAREALAIAEAGGNRSVQARAHVYLSQDAVGPERLAHARRALALSKEVQDASGVQMALRAVAAASLDVDSGSAFRAIQEAIDLARSRGDLAEVARNSLVRSRMRWQSGTREQGIADSVAALDAIDAERRLQPDFLDRARRVDMWRIAYAELVARALSGEPRVRPAEGPSSADLELAFLTMERGRARSLLDHFSRVAHAPVPDAEAVRLQQERDEVWRALVRRQQQLTNPEVVAAEKHKALADLDRLERRDAQLRAELARATNGASSSLTPAFPTLGDIRRALLPDEALLEFQIWAPSQMPDGVAAASWILVSTGTATRAFALPRADVIEMAEIVRMFIGLVDRRDGAEAVAARELYQRVFSTALGDLPEAVTRLVIVPDTTLHDLPFDLLRTPAGEPLGARYELSIAPSATTWLRWRTRDSHVPLRGALAFVDPASWARGSRASSERAWILPTGTILGPLPHARREGEALGRHVFGPSRVLVGSNATEAVFKRTDLSAFGLLHFAAHAVVDDDHPERSAVLLTPGSDEEDGWLQPREIETLALEGKLVVLSACRSANGTLIRGEGLVGLADAFFRAGAHAVVASLWPLRDDEAARLFERFYSHLGDGLNLAAALAAARRELAAAGVPAAAWAGVIVLGDGGIVLRADNASDPTSPSRALALGATLCLTLALGLLLARRTHRLRR